MILYKRYETPMNCRELRQTSMKLYVTYANKFETIEITGPYADKDLIFEECHISGSSILVSIE